VAFDQDDPGIGKDPLDQRHLRHVQRVLVDHRLAGRRRRDLRELLEVVVARRLGLLRRQLPEIGAGRNAAMTLLSTGCSSSTCRLDRFISNVSSKVVPERGSRR
jgi:hypothetical protein